MSKLKFRHNKRRNSCFLFEALTKELTTQIIRKDANKQKDVLDCLKEFFRKGTLVNKEMKLFKYLNENNGLDEHDARELIRRVVLEYNKLDQSKLFEEQTRLINFINKKIGASVYSQYVPSYKNIATISQIFDREVAIPTKIIMENAIVEHLTRDSNNGNLEEGIKLKNSVVSTFTKLFNSSYGDLLKEQKELLQKFVYSVNDASEFKFFLNEELKRLHKILKEHKEDKDIVSDVNMKDKYSKIFSILEQFKDDKPLTEAMISDLMKIQGLAKELADGSN